jgi:hypothetical protein
MKSLLSWVCLISLVIGAGWLAHEAIRANSPTVDEIAYLDGGYDIIKEGDFRGTVSGGVAPLPILLAYWPLAFDRTVQREDLERTNPRAVELIIRGRQAQALVLVPLLLGTVWWVLARRYGLAAALVGGSLAAFSPSLLAFGSLAVTDYCFVAFGLLCTVAIVRYLEQRSARRLLAAGLAMGLAVASKYTGLLFLPILGFCLLVTTPAQTTPGAGRLAGLPRRCWGAAKPVLLCAGMVFVITWGLHGFRLLPFKQIAAGETPANSPWRKLLGGGATADRIMTFAYRRALCPAPLKGLLKQGWLVSEGAPVYLCGRIYPRGSALYYPVALGVKSSQAELVVLAAALGVLLFLLYQAVVRGRPPEPVPLVAGVTSAVFFLAFAASSKQLGLRYVMLLYPLAALIAAHGLTRAATGPARRVTLAGLGALLIGLQLAAISSALPYPIAYFSPLAGGPDCGICYLDDANLDWGQGLAALARYRATRGKDATLGLVYFGPIDPGAYEIDVVAPDRLLMDRTDGPDARARLIGVSATRLCREDRLQGFKGLRPTERIAYSIYLYDLDDPGVAEALRQYLGG